MLRGDKLELSTYSSKKKKTTAGHTQIFNTYPNFMLAYPATARVPYNSSAASLLIGLLRVASCVSCPPSSSRTRLLFFFDFSLVSIRTDQRASD